MFSAPADRLVASRSSESEKASDLENGGRVREEAEVPRQETLLEPKKGGGKGEAKVVPGGSSPQVMMPAGSVRDGDVGKDVATTGDADAGDSVRARAGVMGMAVEDAEQGAFGSLTGAFVCVEGG